jgi:ATP-dependent DNA helicase RecG
LEVSNPGGLPAGMTVEDLKQPHESKPRNKLVADAFFLIKYIEQFGTGIQRIINDCQEAGVPEPEFESRAGAFRVVFRRLVPLERRFAGLDLNKRQLKVLEYLLSNGRITRSDYQTVAATTERTAKRDLNELVKKQLLMKRGAGNNFWYELVGPQPQPGSPAGTGAK